MRLSSTLQVLAQTGYGVWMLLGLALAFGVFRAGRGESLVPLAVGAILVSLGLLLASLRRSWSPDWLGWKPGRRAWPTRSALLGMATYLPMLAVAGLTRGDNAFWATRAVGATLMLCALATLAYDARAAHRGSPVAAGTALETLLFAAFSGGLWLWLFAAADTSVAPGESGHIWVLPLLALGIVVGGARSFPWRGRRAVPREPAAKQRQVVAALLVYALPCLALLLSEVTGGSIVLALLAIAACVAGRVRERRLHQLAVQP